MFNFSPFPNLTSERLTLRKLRLEDENEVFFLRSDNRVLKFIDIPIAKSLEDARTYIRMINKGIDENEWVLWGITLKEAESKIIGTICLWNISKEKNKGEIGYLLHPDFQRKGYMQEATVKVIDFGFNTMNLDVIDADLHSKNDKSLKLLKRNNFAFERESGNMVIYSLAKSVVK